MIVKTIDQGWGQHVPLKQFETEILDQFLATTANDDSRTVVINSTWYTDDLHQQTLSWLSRSDTDRIVLVSMLDGPISRPDWYAGTSIPCHGVGYYPGNNEIDFWALVVSRWFQLPSLHDLVDTSKITKPFICLNRKPHNHRVRLYNDLLELDLLDRGLVSLGSDHGVAIRTIENDQGRSDLAPNADTNQNGIANDIMSLGNVDNWCHCFLDVVTETVFDVDQDWFVSEKIYKPILGLRPFLLYSPNGGRGWLRAHGFRDYVDDFRDITDLDLSDPAEIPKFLLVLSEQSVSYLRTKYIDLMPKIMYNNKRFDAYVQEINNTIQRGIKCPI